MEYVTDFNTFILTLYLLCVLDYGPTPLPGKVKIKKLWLLTLNSLKWVVVEEARLVKSGRVMCLAVLGLASLGTASCRFGCWWHRLAYLNAWPCPVLAGRGALLAGFCKRPKRDAWWVWLQLALLGCPTHTEAGPGPTISGAPSDSIWGILDDNPQTPCALLGRALWQRR